MAAENCGILRSCATKCDTASGRDNAWEADRSITPKELPEGYELAEPVQYVCRRGSGSSFGLASRQVPLGRPAKKVVLFYRREAEAKYLSDHGASPTQLQASGHIRS